MTNSIVRNGGAAYVPPDLLNDTSQIQDDKDYIDVVLTDLNLDTEYKMQFAWVYEDKTISDYSDVFTVTTLAEAAFNKPEFLETDLSSDLNALIIKWSGLDYLGEPYPENLDRVDIYIKGGSFGNDYVVAGFFKEAGKKTIIAQTGTYYVKLQAVSKKKTLSPFSTEWSISTESPSEIIDPPTLPIGLTAAATSFGITINWGGAYQANDPFSGFKTIAIYATTNASLGASTTTAFSDSSLVANLTVSQIPNKINVGIDNLKQALGLSTSSAVYAAQVYFYHLAYNKNDEPYKVSGTTTYTRINSTPLSPTKANLIDLENGLISIENLVAGNGQFTSWLRTGVAGGARIELNGGSSFTNSGETHSVLPGFSVYASGGTPIFRADLSGTVTFGGYTPADIGVIESTATSKAKVFRQNTVPTALASGDIWINTASSSTAAIPGETPQVPAYEGKNTIYVSSAAGRAYWVVSKDLDIATVLARSGNFDLNGNINRAVSLAIDNGVSAGSIASVKTSYTDTATGWFIGYDGTATGSLPVINIGSSTNYLKWTGSLLEIKGDITATSGYIGSDTNGWTINDFGIFANGSDSLISINNGGTLSFGNTSMTTISNQFKIYDSDGYDILSVPTVGGRVLLGHLTEGQGRQVEVARSAQIAGDSSGAGARNSGGLRNMYTATVNNFTLYPNMYLTDRSANGDVLLLWS
jgi:hypothetical protein